METREHDPAEAEMNEASTVEASKQPAASEAVDQNATAAPAATTSLELAELELALSLADIPRAGFETALRTALGSTGGTLLFIMPGAAGETAVAAISHGADAGRETLLAILACDGETVRFETAAESGHPVAGLASSWTRVMERMPAIAA